MGILIFLIILAVLVLTHEFGHFLVAKKAGIRVDEFGLGFPPRIFGIKRGETTYSINWIPFGGFVKIFGETPDDESLTGSDSARSLVNKPRRIQAAVLVAGVLFNVLFAWLLMSVGLATGLPVSEASAPKQFALTDSRLIITDILKNSPAERAELKLGDAIVSASDVRGIKLEKPSPTDLQKYFSTRGGEKVNLQVLKRGAAKDSTPVKLTIIPQKNVAGDKAVIGVALDRVGTLRLPFWQSIWEGMIYTGEMFYLTVIAIINIIIGAFQGGNVLSSVTGPVGLAGIVGNILALGFSYLLSFTALISINLAVLNLLPFPALDGGRLFFLLIEWIKGSPINPKVANTLNLVGFALLLLLMAVVTYKDIARLVVG